LLLTAFRATRRQNSQTSLRSKILANWIPRPWIRRAHWTLSGSVILLIGFDLNGDLATYP